MGDLTDLFGTALPAIWFVETTPDPVPELLAAARNLPHAPAILVFGLESWMSERTAQNEPFWARLNDAREVLIRNVHCPLIFVVTGFLHDAFARAAPDLFSGASAVLRVPRKQKSKLSKMLWLRFPRWAGLDLDAKRTELLELTGQAWFLPEARLQQVELLWWLGQEQEAWSLASDLVSELEPGSLKNEALVKQLLVSHEEPELLYSRTNGLRSQFLKSEDPRWLFETACLVCEIHRDWGNRDVARRFLAALHSANFPEMSPERARMTLLSAILYLDGGDFRSSRDELSIARKITTEFYGPRHPLSLEVDYVMALVAEFEGKFSDARRELSRILELWLALVPVGHRSTRVLKAMERRLLTPPGGRSLAELE
ncbi:tetratricopeptide repeat protein [bacterium]|nr:tetratricopeptide repeat protein [bacterium]